MTLSKAINPLLYLSICLIWGSSFILIKLALFDHDHHVVLTPYQVAALRVLSAGLVLIPIFLKQFNTLPKQLWFYIILSGLLAVFIPAFLFCIAETKLDSALAGTLNALTPIFAILAGVLFYNSRIPGRQIIGIIIGLTGILFLFAGRGQINFRSSPYAGYIVLATMCYGINNNLVKHKLNEISSLTIAALSLVSLIVPAVIILWYTGYFSLPLAQPSYIKSTAASGVLGVFGSALSYIMLYMLLKRTSVVFASSVTYVIPLVALGWGWFYGEHISINQIICLVVILTGVYLTNPVLKQANK